MSEFTVPSDDQSWAERAAEELTGDELPHHNRNELQVAERPDAPRALGARALDPFGGAYEVEGDGWNRVIFVDERPETHVVGRQRGVSSDSLREGMAGPLVPPR